MSSEPSSFNQLNSSPVEADAEDCVNDLPDWLSCREPSPPAYSKERIELDQSRYELIFQSVVEQMCEGVTLSNALNRYSFEVKKGDFRRWVNKDPTRKQMLEEAEKILGECIFDDFVDMTRQLGSVDAKGEYLTDVETFKHKSANLKWLLSVYNRKRFSDPKPSLSVELNATSISITGALEEAEKRLQVIDVDARQITDDSPKGVK